MNRGTPRERVGLLCFLVGGIVALRPWAGGAVDFRYTCLFVGVAALLLLALAYNPSRLLRPVSKPEKALLVAVTLLVGVGALQLLPLGPLADILSPGTGSLRADGVAAGATLGNRTISIYPHASRIALVTLVTGATLALAAFRGIRTLREARCLAAALVVSATLNALVGVAQPLLDDPLPWWPAEVEGVWSRARGTYGSPNHFAGLCALALPLALALALSDPGLRRRGGSSLALLWLAPAGLLVGGILLSTSRSGALAALAGGITFVALADYGTGRRWSPPRLAGFGLLAVAGAVGLSPLAERFAQVTNDSRLDTWKGAVDILSRVPVFGSGLGTYAQVSPQHVASPLVPNAAHNDYLNLFSDAGLAGGLLGLAALAAFLLCVRSGLRRLPHGRRRTLLAGATGSVVGLLVASVVEFNLQIPANLWAFAAIGGLALAMVGLRRTRQVTPPAWQRRTLAVALSLAACLLAVTAVRLGVSETLVARELEGTKRVEALKSAEAWAPESSAPAAGRGEVHATAGDAEAAVLAFARACAREPRNARHHMSLARALLLVGRYERAEEELALAEQLTPYFPRFHLYAGLLRWWRLGQDPPAADADALRKRAVGSLRAAVALDRSMLQEVLTRHLDSNPLLADLLAVLPADDPAAHGVLADLLVKRDRRADALRVLGPEARRSGAAPEQLLQWARLQLSCGGGDLAADGFRRAALTSVGEARRTILAEARARLRSAGYADAAMVLLWQVSASCPEDGGVQLELGLALMDEGAHDEAARALTRARGLGVSESHRHLALAYRLAGRPSSACESLRAAMPFAEDRADEAALRVRLARILKQRGRIDDAIEEYERALRLDPRDDILEMLQRLR